MTWLGVALGGALGSVLRHGVGMVLARATFGWPMGTLLVNVTGSFLIGVFARWLSAPGVDPALRLALTVGVCGGFTTFSTFSAELVTLAQEGRLGRALAYTAVSLALGVLATVAGLALGERLLAGATRGG